MSDDRCIYEVRALELLDRADFNVTVDESATRYHTLLIVGAFLAAAVVNALLNIAMAIREGHHES
jgi:hypothetical protein